MWQKRQRQGRNHLRQAVELTAHMVSHVFLRRVGIVVMDGAVIVMMMADAVLMLYPMLGVHLGFYPMVGRTHALQRQERDEQP